VVVILTDLKNMADCHDCGHWLVQFKVCIITTAWRQRNSKPFLIWWLINFLQIYFIFARIFARFCKFQKLCKFVLNIDFIMALKPDGLCVYETTKQDNNDIISVYL
jgi:hypothetical protein